eukprot:6194209-Pleurochrysis_carterae.AAC.1
MPLVWGVILTAPPPAIRPIHGSIALLGRWSADREMPVISDRLVKLVSIRNASGISDCSTLVKRVPPEKRRSTTLAGAAIRIHGIHMAKPFVAGVLRDIE